MKINKQLPGKFEKVADMSENTKILITYGGLTEKHLQQIRQTSEKITVEVATEKETILHAIQDADIIFGSFRFSKEMFLASKQLKWIHVSSAGVERNLFSELVNSNVVLTNSSGIHRTPMSEMAIAMMLVFAKRLHTFIRYQLERKWKRLLPDELHGKTIGILGLGNVGMETAWKAKFFGMKIIALKMKDIRRPTYVDEILGPEDLDYLLSESDYLVITVPLTEKTYHLIRERELQLMKPSAYIINVSRGAVIDNLALIKALREGWIEGAGLDVFEEEPLPHDSEFWNLKNVVITPHVSGANPYYTDRAVTLFCQNLARYLAGKPLINVVNKKAGY